MRRALTLVLKKLCQKYGSEINNNFFTKTIRQDQRDLEGRKQDQSDLEDRKQDQSDLGGRRQDQNDLEGLNISYQQPLRRRHRPVPPTPCSIGPFSVIFMKYYVKNGIGNQSN